MICCANQLNNNRKTKCQLNNEQLASILEVPVHSGTKMEKHWADLLRTFLEIGATNSSQILKVFRLPKVYIGGRWLWCQLQDFFLHYPELDPECHFHVKKNTSTISDLKLASIIKVGPPGMTSKNEEQTKQNFFYKKVKLLLEIGATTTSQLESVANDPLLGSEALVSQLKLFFEKYPQLDMYCLFTTKKNEIEI